jgi:MoaA/NifB/PqqE/SkfB family radical SAM enzyme
MKDGDHATRVIDVIWNMTAVCPHDCANCCVDAVHAMREGKTIRIRRDGLTQETRLPRPPGGVSIYDATARHLQAQDLELDVGQKLRLIDNIDVRNARLDISGGDPLCVTENMQILRAASAQLGRKNVTLTATGAGLAGVNLQEVASLVGEYNFTFDSASVADVAHRPKMYAARNFRVAQRFAALGAVTRAEFPITRSTSAPDHLRRLYKMLHEAGINKLLLMRLFPVGRGETVADDTLTAREYSTAIATLRSLEAEFGSPTLKLQCALRHFEGMASSRPQAINPCDMVQESFGVTPDGTMLMSPWAINGRGRPMDATFVLGNLFQQKLSDILASDRVAEVRRRANENHGHCKIFAFLNSTRLDPFDRLFDSADPLYQAALTPSVAA